MAEESKGMGFNWGDAINAVAPIAGTIYSMFQNKDAADRRQVKQQQKLTDIAVNANKDTAKYSSDLQYDMWNKTNYEAQVKHAEAAGLNPAMLYGMGGAGGATTGSASAGTQGAASAANAAQERQVELGMGMQLAQTQLLAAQARKTEAETKNIEAETGKTGVETETGKLNLDTAQKTQEATIQTIQEGAAKALAEAVQSQQKQVITEETMKDQIKSIQQEAINKILTNNNLKIENRIKTAEETIRKMEAKAAENGVGTNAPWYIKLMSKLYDDIENKFK